jgi:hypothetical protein
MSEPREGELDVDDFHRVPQVFFQRLDALVDSLLAAVGTNTESERQLQCRRSVLRSALDSYQRLGEMSAEDLTDLLVDAELVQHLRQAIGSRELVDTQYYMSGLNKAEKVGVSDDAVRNLLELGRMPR